MDNSDGSHCPENSNSTDCLLRALLQFLNEQQDADDAETNWDPINFTFTLLIGLVAILFALATILQAIFTAGKGRRKTNHLAVGEWSKKTKKKWDWSEMNFHFTALVPILRDESLRTLRSKGHEDVVHPPRLKSLENPQQPSQSGPPSAAWLQFFGEVGLDKLDISDWGDNVREVPIEYLPDDLVAAPAYVQLGAIVALAATRGIHKVGIDQQNYPILFGRGFQVDFRQHPTLGVVGGYSRYYDRTNTQPRTPDLVGIELAMQHGQGTLEASVPQPPYRYIYQNEKVDCSTQLSRRRLLEKWAHGLRIYASGSNDSAFALQEFAISEAHLPLIVGFFAITPNRVPALFPTTILQTQNPLTALALNGKYWAEARLDKVQRLDIKDFPVLSPFDRVMIPSWYAFDWHHYDRCNLRNDPEAWDDYLKTYGKKYRGKDIEALKALAEQFDPKNAYGHCAVLHMCFKLLQEPENLAVWFFELPVEVQEELRRLTLGQIKEIDRWLEATSRSTGDSVMRSYMLWATTIEILQAEQTVKGQRPSKKEEESNSSNRHQPRNQGQRQSTGASRRGHTTAVTIHSTLLESLRGWKFDEKSTPDGTKSHIESGFDSNQFMRLWERLCPLIITMPVKEDEGTEGEGKEDEGKEDEGKEDEGNKDKKSEGEESESEESEGQEQEQEQRRRWKRDEKVVRDIDDVIIYRVLMVLLLFRTSMDSSKVLESGLWDIVVPMI